jgi:hypothetical protein
MIGKKVRARVYDRATYPEIVTILDKIRGVYVYTITGIQDTPATPTERELIAIDYYLCKQEDGNIVYVKPSSIESIIEESTKPSRTY